MSEQEKIIHAKINAETGKISWAELQRHFARGTVVKVASELDLIDVAITIAEDDKIRFSSWTDNGQIARASDQDARDWNQRSPDFWAVVVAPWILVQELADRTH